SDVGAGLLDDARALVPADDREAGRQVADGCRSPGAEQGGRTGVAVVTSAMGDGNFGAESMLLPEKGGGLNRSVRQLW
ncbi:hypothetical protein, partial [Frankia sp. CcWB3]